MVPLVREVQWLVPFIKIEEAGRSEVQAASHLYTKLMPQKMSSAEVFALAFLRHNRKGPNLCLAKDCHSTSIQQQQQYLCG